MLLMELRPAAGPPPLRAGGALARPIAATLALRDNAATLALRANEAPSDVGMFSALALGSSSVCTM